MSSPPAPTTLAPGRKESGPAVRDLLAPTGPTLSLREALRLCGEPRQADNPIEQAEVCARVRREILRQQSGLSPEALDRVASARLGLSVADLRRSLQVRELSAEVRDLVADGELSVDQALAVSQISEARRQRALARAAAADELSPPLIERAASLLARDPALRVRVAIQRARRLPQP